MKAVSHIAVGVSEMDRSLHFYRDLLGLKVCLDTMENIGGLKTLFANPVKGKRRAVYLRFEDGPHASFIVLSQNPVEVTGRRNQTRPSRGTSLRLLGRRFARTGREAQGRRRSDSRSAG